MDFSSAVAALQAGDGEFKGVPVLGNTFHRVVRRTFDIDSACAADVDDSFFLAVDVYHPAALYQRAVEGEGAVHADFFHECEDCLQRAVLCIGVGEKGHCHCHRDSVVSAQARVPGLEEVSVLIDLDGVLFKIMGAARNLHADHIHVTLKGHGRAVFITRCGTCAYDDVSGLVADGLETVFPCP